MLATAHDWDLQVERGPGWLLVKVGPPSAKAREMPSLADRLQSLLEDHFTYRLVLELDQIDRMNRDFIGELLALFQWIRAHGGVMRLCGLSAHNEELLDRCGLNCLLPAYEDRLGAVFGYFHTTLGR
jgi:anti-anti-sigma regulatory factor